MNIYTHTTVIIIDKLITDSSLTMLTNWAQLIEYTRRHRHLALKCIVEMISQREKCIQAMELIIKQ